MRSPFLRVLGCFAVAVGALYVNGCASDATSTDSPKADVLDVGEVTGEPTDGAGDVGAGDGPLTGADDLATAKHVGIVAAKGDELTATANVNLRSGPATTFAILAVIPTGSIVEVLDAKPTNGFLNIAFNGLTGWSSGTLFTAPAPGGGATGVDVDGPPSPDNAIARAKSAVGFSYYWGGGAWLPTGPTASTAGACKGNCPSCTHSGTYGADCSGLVAKAWQFGPKSLTVNAHPYGTVNFVNAVAGKWSVIPRESVRKGDSLVYNTSGTGHMVIVEKGDAWGALTVYECRGCAYGCTYGSRAFASTYKTIRRTGF